MRALIQRVSSASVSTGEGNVNSIDQGFCILLGVGPDDTEQIAEKLWSKISKLRIFEDQDGKPTYRYAMWMVPCFWFLNSRSTLIVVRATAPRSPKEPPPTWLTIYMSTSRNSLEMMA